MNVMSNPDKNLTCRDCGKDFVFTESEQEFHAQKGYQNAPARCPECRAQRKTQFAGRTGRELHTTQCAACGKEAQVPFVPRGDKPVYCADCFKTQRAETRR
jgi:CxxC-x17-CxxC domain-containing protein